MNRAFFRPALLVTGFNLIGQVLSLASQSVAAAYFGAGSQMDSYFAGLNVPVYLSAVVTGALSSIFLPVISAHLKESGDEAYSVAATILVLCLAGLSALAAIGILAAPAIVAVTTPALNPESYRLAVQVSMLIWPMVIATAAWNILAALAQARRNFLWTAAGPVVGSLIGLLLVIYLAPRIGVTALAIGMLVGTAVPVAFVFPELLRLRPSEARSLRAHHESVRTFFRTLWPVLFSGLLVRGTPLIDRYLASGLAAGTISHLGFSSRIALTLSTVLSTGIATVAFPSLADHAADDNRPALKATTSRSLRAMWIFVAPVTAVGFVLAGPLITVLFERGRFSRADTVEVTRLLSVYLITMIPMALGTITARALYALRLAKLVSLVSVLETLPYAFYTWGFSRAFGPVGFALGSVTYFVASITWQLFVLRSHFGGGRGLAVSGLRTAAIAALASGASYAAISFSTVAVSQLIVGLIVGIGVYLAAQLLLNRTEIQSLRGRAAA